MSRAVASIMTVLHACPAGKARAIGNFGMGAVLAPALGPSLRGLLLECEGWRSTFVVVVGAGSIDSMRQLGEGAG